MARYSSNFGNKLQMMVETGKECGFTSNFDLPRSFTPRKLDLWPKMANSQSDYRTARVEVEQRTHSGDEIGYFIQNFLFFGFSKSYRLCVSLRS